MGRCPAQCERPHVRGSPLVARGRERLGVEGEVTETRAKTAVGCRSSQSRGPRTTNPRPRRTPRSRRDSALSHGSLKPQFLESVEDNGDLWVDRVRYSR